MHEIAVEVRASIVTIVKEGKVKSEDCLKLLMQLFGPNSNTRFPLKKNYELLKSLTQNMSTSDAKEYINYLESMYKNPTVEEFFPAQTPEADQSEDEEMKDQDQ